MQSDIYKNTFQRQKADILNLFVNFLIIEDTSATFFFPFSQFAALLDAFGPRFVSSPAWLCFQRNVSFLHKT